MALKFLNKKGWHTGSLRNIENVWKAEQKHDAEQRKLEELRKQIQDEREKHEFRLLQEQAGLQPRQERLDFLYESGLAVGKGSSEGFQALKQPAPAAATSSASASSSKAAGPGALFEDKPQSANDAWRKLHSDPLLLIRQREQEAIARIKNNPIKMAEIKKSVETDKKQKEEKKDKKKHRKHHLSESKSKWRHSNNNSDSEEISDDEDGRRNRGHQSPEQKREEKRSRHEKRRRRDSSDSEDDEPRRRHRDMLKHGERSRRDHSDRDDRKRRPTENCRAYSTYEKFDSRHGRMEDERKSGHSVPERHSRSEPGLEEKGRRDSQQGRNNGSGYNRRRGVHHMSEEERLARLQQMQVDADLHEEQRWRRLKKAEADDDKEAASAGSYRGKNFLDDAQKSIFGTEKGGSSTIEESVRRRAYYSQGGSDAHERNAFRR